MIRSGNKGTTATGRDLVYSFGRRGKQGFIDFYTRLPSERSNELFDKEANADWFSPDLFETWQQLRNAGRIDTALHYARPANYLGGGYSHERPVGGASFYLRVPGERVEEYLAAFLALVVDNDKSLAEEIIADVRNRAGKHPKQRIFDPLADMWWRGVNGE